MPAPCSGKRNSKREGHILEIRGLLKTSLIDYPGEICATLFVGGCNLRCPFCYNRELVLDGAKLPLYAEAEIMDFLHRRCGLLGAVCISGGEPALQDGLIEFVATVKTAGFKIKLDTNGTRPRVLADLLQQDLLDYVAVDIKAPAAKYHSLTGVNTDYGAIARTVNLLRDSCTEHEFRTTFVPALLHEEDILKIAETLSGCRRYVIQKFRHDAMLLDPTLESSIVAEPQEMELLARRCRDYVNEVELRGY